LLSADENERRRRYQFACDERAFVLSRAVLRILLSRYLSRSASDIPLCYGRYGKPQISQIQTDLQFNIAHSGGIAVYAFAQGSSVGIDVEEVRPSPEMESIARGYFCPEETRDLLSLPLQDREIAFFRCWTRKEAYIKGEGTGLSRPLDSFRVTLRNTDPVRLVRVDGNADAARGWTLFELTPLAGYICALAYHDVGRIVRLQPIVSASDMFDQTIA
jgi:4'-phosphopantetheinyl transferase